MSATLDPLGFNLDEMVAALPTQQERDELMLFIEEHLKRGTGSGILRGMFLLLKANRCYLEKLPEEFSSKLIEPTRDLFLRLEKSLNGQIETQKQIAVQYQRSNERSIEVVDRLDGIVPKIENVVQRSFDKIDTKRLTDRITTSIVEATVDPVNLTSRELAQMFARFSELVDIGKEAFAILRKIAWRAILFGSLSTSILICSVVLYFSHQAMQRSFDASLESIRAEQHQKLLDLQARVNYALAIAGDNDYVAHRLSRLGLTTDVKPLTDGTDRYALSLSKAYEAKILPDGTGVIYFQGPDLSPLIEQEIEEMNKLLHH